MLQGGYFRKRKLPIKQAVVVVVILLFLFTNNYLYDHSIGFLGSKISGLMFFAGQGFSRWGEKMFGFESMEELKSENERLAKENGRLLDLLRKNSIKLENASLNDQLDLKEGQVIGREAFFDSPTIFLDIGLKDGVEKGMVVLDENEAVIGKVKEVKENSSLVILTYHVESRIGAWIAGTEWGGVLEGNKNLRAILEMLPLESKVEKGMEIVTDNSEAKIPSGLFLGKVAEVKESEDHLFKEAILDLTWEARKLLKVWVVRGRK